MNDSDEAIDKVFAGLRDAVPREGLERRVLAGVYHRAAAPRTWPIRWAMLGGFAFAAAAVVVLFAVPRHSSAPPAAVQAQSPATPPAQAEYVPARPRRHSSAIRANAEAPPANVLTASFPAPPMPLTEQERLLVKLAQHGAPKAVATLDPNALAEQEARSEQVFEAFLASAQEPSIMKHKEDIR